MKRKCLAIGIIVLFLSTTCIPVLASEGKPDLVITDISISPGSMIGTHVCDCTIKNIGNSSTGDLIEIRIIVKRKPLGIFPPLFTVFSRSITFWVGGGLEPGESIPLPVIDDCNLPSFGFFKFSCTVNPGRTIEESNYDNNDLAEKYIAFLGIWIERG